MRPGLHIRNLGGAHAAILHRPHAVVQSLARQLTAIGLEVSTHWPDLGADAFNADFIFFDVDMGHDAQFPWPPGEAPMPTVALIGSEAPGRIEWALAMGAHAQLVKPIGDSGVYSALLIAREAFYARRALSDEIKSLRERLDERKTVVRAVTFLAARGMSEAEAYSQIQRMAMNWRVSFEAAARRIVARYAEEDGKDGDERSHGR